VIAAKAVSGKIMNMKVIKNGISGKIFTSQAAFLIPSIINTQFNLKQTNTRQIFTQTHQRQKWPDL